VLSHTPKILSSHMAPKRLTFTPTDRTTFNVGGCWLAGGWLVYARAVGRLACVRATLWLGQPMSQDATAPMIEAECFKIYNDLPCGRHMHTLVVQDATCSQHFDYVRGLDSKHVHIQHVPDWGRGCGNRSSEKFGPKN
jgi:hypothetical protein